MVRYVFRKRESFTNSENAPIEKGFAQSRLGKERPNEVIGYQNHLCQRSWIVIQIKETFAV